jgi:shikimate kinase
MGSGKSFTGKKIAASLRWSFVDTDRLVEEENGISVEEIFSHYGEPFFREAEKKALRNIALKSRNVVACGGGTPCSEENITVMKETGVVLYLKLPVTTLVARLQKSRTVRPLLQYATDADLTKRVQELLELRSPWYERADLVADGMTSSVDEMTGQLAEIIRDKGAFL